MPIVGLPVRTTLLQNARARCIRRFALDYQSERHCSKTRLILIKVYMRWITSQNDTAPKPDMLTAMRTTGWITSQNDTAPKRPSRCRTSGRVGLPVRTTLLQNWAGRALVVVVGLPVRTTLLQNRDRPKTGLNQVGLPVRTTLLQN